MPNKLGPEEQFKIVTQINAAVDKMAVTMDRVERSWESQASMATKLAEAIDQLKFDQITHGIESIIATSKKAIEAFDDLGSSAEQNVRKMLIAVRGAEREVTSFGDKTRAVFDNVSKSSAASANSLGDVASNAKALNVAVGSVNSSMGSMSASTSAATDEFRRTGTVGSQSMQDVAKTLVETVKGMAAFDQATQNSSNTLGGRFYNAITGASKQAQGLRADTASLASQSFPGLNREMDKYMSQLVDFGDGQSSATKKLAKFGKTATIGFGALSGLSQGLKNVAALTKSATHFTLGLVDSIFQIGVSLVSIPIKIFTGIVDMAAKADGGFTELLQAIENVRKEFGTFSGPASHAVMVTSRSLQNFSQTGLSTWRVFGNLAERMDYVREVATAMGPTFGIVEREFRDNGGAILAYQKGLGVAAESMRSLADRAISTGEPLGKLMLDLTKQTLGLGRAFDVDQKLIGRDVSKAIGDVRHFGQSTVKEIGQAVVYSRKLGVELEKITGLLDAFETFDSAAENAAKMSQSFGVTIDAFKMMEAQSPDEQLEMLRKQLRLGNVDTSNFNRQQLRLLSTVTGLDDATAKQVFSLKNQGVSLDDIRKKGEKSQRQQMTQAEALSRLSDSIERMVKSMGSQTGSFFDMFIKGVFRGMQASKEFRGMIMNIKMSLQTVMFEGVKLGLKFMKLFKPAQDFFGGLENLFQPAKFQKLFGSITKELATFSKDLSEGRTSLPKLMEHMKKYFFDFLDSEKPAGQQILRGAKGIFTSLTLVVGNAIPFIAHKVGEGLQVVSKLIVDLMSGKIDLAGPTKGASGFLETLLRPIFKGLRDAWRDPTLRKGINDFASAIGTLLHSVFSSPTFHKVAKTVTVALAGALFSPVIIQTVLAGLTTRLMGSTFSLFKNVVSKGGAKSLAQAGAARSASKLASVAGPGALIALAAATGKGVLKYTGVITSSLDRSSQVIAGATTGVVDALTLGLLPDDFTTKIANVAAQASDTITSVFSSLLGRGIVESLKRRLADTFEIFGNVYDFVAQLLTGNQADFVSSAKKLGLSLLRFAVDSFEVLLVQLPLVVGRIATTVMETMSGVIIKLVTGALGIITSGVDLVFGTDFTKKVEGLSDSLTKGVHNMGDSVAGGLKHAGDVVSDAVKGFNDRNLRSIDDQTKITQSAVDASVKATNKINELKTSSPQLPSQADVGQLSGLVSALSDVKVPDAKASADAVKQLNDLSSQVSTLTSQLDTNLLDSTKIADIQTRLASTTSVFDSLKSIPATLNASVSSIKSNGFQPAVRAVEDMVRLANELDDALSNERMNGIDIRTKLQKLANNVGLGSKGSYTIHNKSVNLTVNLQVEINAEELEKTMLMRTKSVITQRINWALNNPNDKGGPDIPTTKEGTILPVNKV